MRAMVFAVLVVLLMAGRARGVTIADGDHHFSFDTPQGWSELPQSVLNRVNQLTGQDYIRGAHQGSGLLPSCAVKPLPMSQADPSSDLDGIRSGMASVAHQHGWILGDVTFDSRRNAIVMLVQIPSAKGMLQCIGYLFFGKNEEIALYCYSTQQDFQNLRPDFEQIADSFKFDDGYAAPGFLTPTMKMWLGAGGVLVVGVFLARGIARRENRARQAERFESF